MCKNKLYTSKIKLNKTTIPIGRVPCCELDVWLDNENITVGSFAPFVSASQHSFVNNCMKEVCFH